MTPTPLPQELHHLLNHAYFLHILATDSAKVIPPGKSLLSMMAHTPVDTNPSPLQARVEQVVHKAFWDEAHFSLSSTAPSVQLPRLKLLYKDLRDALLPLFPPKHPILINLAAPLPPTSSPLHSTLTLLREILLSLRQRCAPARDPDIDTLLANLASSPIPAPPPLDMTAENPLATLVISTLRDIIALADTLKRDLKNSLLGVMSEEQLAATLRQQARERERVLVMDTAMWGDENGKRGVEIVMREWSRWLGSPSPQIGHRMWTSCLLRALSSPTPITCQPLNPDSNALPPQFFFSHPSLFYLQNYLQALVIAASLKSLVKFPQSAVDSVAPINPSAISSLSDFIPRVWSLLITEIGHDEYLVHNASANPRYEGNEGESETKLLNLADEVIRARQSFSDAPSVSEKEEHELRAAVERTLRLKDPVFLLLQSRLIRTIEQRIENLMGGASNANRVHFPQKMKTGIVSGSIMPSSTNGFAGNVLNNSAAPPVKGFDHELLAQGIEDASQKLVACIRWVEGVWGDTISTDV